MGTGRWEKDRWCDAKVGALSLVIQLDRWGKEEGHGPQLNQSCLRNEIPVKIVGTQPGGTLVSVLRPVTHQHDKAVMRPD